MDRAHSLTDKKLEEMEKHLSEIYARSQKELEKKTKKFWADFERKDIAKKKKLDAGEITEADYKKWRQGQLMTGKHWDEMTKAVAEEMVNADKTAAAYVNGKLPEIYSLNYNALADQTAGIEGYSFELVNADAVKHLATTDKSLLPYKKVDGKNVERWNTQKVNSEVLQGIIQGESVKKIAKRLRNVVGMEKNSAIRNARTTTTGAENRGRLDSYERAQKDGIILKKRWIATHDHRTRDWHTELDNVEVEIDEPFVNSVGEIMFPGDPNAHPANVYNCFVGETNIATDSEVIRSYKHNYSGRFVTVKTAGGVNFTCTPNHPILTIGGWVPAESLQKGNDILVAFRRNDVFGRINPNINHVFPRIDAIHDFLNMSGGKRATSKMVNFHGDIPASDVEIITQKWFLGSDWNTSGSNSVDKFLLKHANKTFMGKSALVKHFGRIGFAALGFVGGVSKSLPFFFTGLRHPEIHRLRPIALLYSGRVKPLDNDVARNAELISECLDGFSGFVFADNIVSVDFSSGCSHVYNLQTENGYYFVNSSIAQSKRKSNGIFAIAHNCRCAMVAEIKGFIRR